MAQCSLPRRSGCGGCGLSLVKLVKATAPGRGAARCGVWCGIPGIPAALRVALRHAAHSGSEAPNSWRPGRRAATPWQGRGKAFTRPSPRGAQRAPLLLVLQAFQQCTVRGWGGETDLLLLPVALFSPFFREWL